MTKYSLREWHLSCSGGRPHNPAKKISGKKVLAQGDAGKGESPQMLPAEPAGPGASTGMPNENSIHGLGFWGAVSLPVLGYTLLAQAGLWWCPSRGFLSVKCALFPLGSSRGELIPLGYLSQSLRRVKTSPLCSPRGFLLVLGAKYVKLSCKKHPVQIPLSVMCPIPSPSGSSQQQAGGLILINTCEILFVSSPALPHVKFFPAGGFLCSLM